MKKNILILIIFITNFIIFSNVFAENTANNNIINIELPPCPEAISGSGPCPATVGSNDIANFIKRFYIFALTVVGILAVGAIVIGAIYYAVSGGIPDRQKEGVSMITSAVWGLVLLFGSYLILQTINPRLTKLENPGGEKLISPINASLIQQPPSNDCGDFINIKAISADNIVLSGGPGGNLEQSPIVPGSGPVNDKGAASCALRRVITRHGINIDSGQYYDEEEFIDKNSKVWLYPYFIKNTDPKATARCLVYARKEDEGDDSAKLIDLNSGLELCAPKPQASGVICNKWKMVTTAYKGIGFTGGYTEIVLEKEVDSTFNFGNINNPPGRNEMIKLIKEKRKDITACYSLQDDFPYCKEPVWICSEYKYQTGSGGTTSFVPRDNPDQGTKNLANTLLGYINNGTIAVNRSGSCDTETSAYDIIFQVAQGKYPKICFNSCNKLSICPYGGPNGNISLSKPLLHGLIFAAQKVKNGEIPNFIITSLTGGSHAVNSYHYKGRAADIYTPTNEWQKLLNFMKGLSEVVRNDTKCEYYQYGKLYRTDNCSEIFGAGKTGQHIHVTFKE